MGKGNILVLHVRVQPIMAGKAWWKETKVVSHIVSTAPKESRQEMNYKTLKAYSQVPISSSKASLPTDSNVFQCAKT